MLTFYAEGVLCTYMCMFVYMCMFLYLTKIHCNNFVSVVIRNASINLLMHT